MSYKQILVTQELHQQIKAAAALQGQSILEFAESALRRALPDAPLLPFGDTPRRLVDPAVEYETEE